MHVYQQRNSANSTVRVAVDGVQVNAETNGPFYGWIADRDLHPDGYHVVQVGQQWLGKLCDIVLLQNTLLDLPTLYASVKARQRPLCCVAAGRAFKPTN